MQNFLPRQLVVNLIQLYQCGLKAAGYQKKKKKKEKGQALPVQTGNMPTLERKQNSILF